MPRRRLISAVTFALSGILLAATPARAGSPLPADYQVDLFIGPVFGSSRIIGMGGAYTGLAEGAEGQLYNPAAVGHRFRHSLTWFDIDVGFDWYIFLFEDKTDFDNFALTNFDDFDATMLFVAPALHFGRGSFGISWVGRFFRYTNERAPIINPAILDPGIIANRFSASFAWRFFDGRLVLGGGARLATLRIREPGTGAVCQIATGATIRPELGVLWLPRIFPIRAGMTIRTASATSPDPEACDTDPFVIGGKASEDFFSVPNRAVVPFEIALGLSIQLGERVFNRRWVNARDRVEPLVTAVEHDRARRRTEFEERLRAAPPEGRPELRRLWAEEEEATRAREDDFLRRARKHWGLHDVSRLRWEPRRYLTINVDVLFTAPTNFGRDATAAALPTVGLDAMLLQQGYTSGAFWSISPRLGVESEVLHDRLRLRGGAYLEPPRYDGSTYRPHLTTGGDVRLFYWRPPVLFSELGFKASFTADFGLAIASGRQYFNVSVGLGLWH